MSFHEQVHVVRHDFQRDDLPAVLRAFRADQFLAADLDRAGQDRAAILRAPHDVIPEIVDATSGNLNLSAHADEYKSDARLTVAPRRPGTRLPTA